MRRAAAGAEDRGSRNGCPRYARTIALPALDPIAADIASGPPHIPRRDRRRGRHRRAVRIVIATLSLPLQTVSPPATRTARRMEVMSAPAHPAQLRQRVLARNGLAQQSSRRRARASGRRRAPARRPERRRSSPSPRPAPSAIVARREAGGDEAGLRRLLVERRVDRLERNARLLEHAPPRFAARRQQQFHEACASSRSV